MQLHHVHELHRRPYSPEPAGNRLLGQVHAAHPTISTVWVDQGFKNQTVEHGARLGINVDIVERTNPQPSFHVLKRRQVAERTIGW